MGKARIIAKLEPDGLYRIKQLPNYDVASELRHLENMIERMALLIDDPETAAIARGAYKLQRAEYEREKRRLEAYPDEGDDVMAWMVDLPAKDNEPAAGQEVGTIGIDREENGEVLNIQPCFEGEHVYNAERDGVMRPVELMNPFWQYFNAAVSPALSKWHPRYRHGVISNIDTDKNTATVKYESAFAKGNDRLYVNKVDVSYGVPIQYMDCDGKAFAELDEVVVRFKDNHWETPVIIGFKHNPKPCREEPELVYVRLDTLGFVWDMKTNDYPEELQGIRTIHECQAFLSGKTETTLSDTQYYGLPYERLLATFYTDAGYTVFHYKITSWGLKEHGEEPGWLYDEYEASRHIEDEEEYYSDTVNWSAGNTPWGVIRPSYANAFWCMKVLGFCTQFTHETIKEFSTFHAYFYFYPQYVCPLDDDLSYYGYGTSAEYGNDPLGIASPCFRMSERTVVQLTFCSYAGYKGSGNVYAPTWEYTTGRTTVAACSCETIDPENPVQPKDMPRNDDFSDAVRDLIEELHILTGEVVITYTQAGCTSQNCEDGLCPSWAYTTYPYLEIKIYER